MYLESYLYSHNKICPHIIVCKSRETFFKASEVFRSEKIKFRSPGVYKLHELIKLLCAKNIFYTNHKFNSFYRRPDHIYIKSYWRFEKKSFHEIVNMRLSCLIDSEFGAMITFKNQWIQNLHLDHLNVYGTFYVLLWIYSVKLLSIPFNDLIRFLRIIVTCKVMVCTSSSALGIWLWSHTSHETMSLFTDQ